MSETFSLKDRVGIGARRDRPKSCPEYIAQGGDERVTVTRSQKREYVHQYGEGDRHLDEDAPDLSGYIVLVMVAGAGFVELCAEDAQQLVKAINDALARPTA